METPATAPSRKRPRPLILLGVGIAALLGIALFCGTVLFFVTRTSPATVTPWMETRAREAFNNPSRATIDLAEYGHPWYPADGRDFAVHGDLVIFPQPPSQGPRSQFIQVMVADVTMSAIVYDPTGQIVNPDPKPPDPARSWYYVGEWFLYDCQRLADFPDWWRCTLLVGGNI